MQSEADAFSLALHRLRSPMEAGDDRIQRRFEQVQQVFTALGERMDRHFAAAEAVRAAERVQLLEMLEKSRGPAQLPHRRSSAS